MDEDPLGGAQKKEKAVKGFDVVEIIFNKPFPLAVDGMGLSRFVNINLLTKRWGVRLRVGFGFIFRTIDNALKFDLSFS